MRPITGIGRRRKASASRSSPLARIASANDGSRSTGNAPEPIWPRTGSMPTWHARAQRTGERRQNAFGQRADLRRRTGQRADRRQPLGQTRRDRRRAATSLPAPPAAPCRGAARASSDCCAMRSIRCLACRRCRPACGPPSSLSPEKVTTSMPASIASRAVGSCGRPQVSRSTSVPLPRSSISGRPFSRASGTSSAADTDLVKPCDGVVRGMDLHDRRGVGSDRGGIVLEMRAVGGADLDQAAAGARHDVGNAEGAADLDQLAARDDHLAARPPARSAPAARRRHCC